MTKPTGKPRRQPKTIIVQCKHGCGTRLRRLPQNATNAACPDCARRYHVQHTLATRKLRRMEDKLIAGVVEPEVKRGPTPEQIRDYAYWGNL